MTVKPRIACVNLKGGVGKTALAVNLAAYCGRKGLRTLLIDLDPQTNASFATVGVEGWDKHQREFGTLADILGLKRHASAEGKSKSVKEIIAKNVLTNVDLLPSHLDLFSIDLDLAGAPGRERKLKKALSPVLDDYDVIISDCPPNLTIPTQNALALSTHYVIPVSPDFLSGVGVALLISRIQEYCADIDHEVQRIGIVLSRVGRPSQHRLETVEALRETFPDVLHNELKERSAVSEAAEQHCSVFDRHNSEAAREFEAVCREILEAIGIGD